MSALRKKMIRDLELRRFSVSTQKSYLAAVRGLAKYYMISPDKISEEQLLDYVHFLITKRKLSCSSLNVATAGLRFFYKETLACNAMAMAIPPRKNSRKLPEIFSYNELKRLFASTNNQKHRLMLMTAYSGGLRVGELIHLRVRDIDSERMTIRIKNGKGGKDRYTILSQRLLDELRCYWKKYRLEDFLFPSAFRDKVLVRQSPNLAFKAAKKKAGITKKVTFHSLRHTFATNLLEAGVDIRTIQILLGHSSITTTARYLHVARKDIKAVKSPLDMFDLPDTDRFKRLNS